MNPTPPKGYRLMRANERPTYRKADKFYEKHFRRWDWTTRCGDMPVKHLLNGFVAAYARKKKGMK